MRRTMRKRNSKSPDSNKNILRLTYAITAVFALMIGYMVWFMQAESENAINNPYNARLDHLSEQVIRGKILSNDGRVLAETIVGEDGAEVRGYPYGPLFCHTVGWATRGKTGMEELANFYLLTSHDSLAEKVIREMMDEKDPGDNVVTTLDVDLQQAAYAALGERKGAVAVMEVDTGKILAMVSKPDFDPNQVNTLWDSLVSGEQGEGLLLNRVSQGVYPPGSTFKIVTLLEYMRQYPDEYQNFHFDCDGTYEQGEYTIRCYHGNAHGSQDIAQCFANSCNGAFAYMGTLLNHDSMKKTAEELLFRKLLTERIVKYGELPAVLASGLFFGLFHGNLNQFSYAFLIGLFLGFIYVKTGKLRYTIGLHMAINFIGSSLGTWMLRVTGYMDTMETLTKFLNTKDPTVLADLGNGIVGMFIFGSYASLILMMAGAGLILTWLNRKKFVCCAPEEKVASLGKKKAAVMIGNPGILLYGAFWIGIMIWQLLQ